MKNRLFLLDIVTNMRHDTIHLVRERFMCLVARLHSWGGIFLLPSQELVRY